MEKTRTTPYHPQSDGMVEPMNRTIQDMLAKYSPSTSVTGMFTYPWL